MDDHIHIHMSMLFTSILTISFLLITTLPQSHCQLPPQPGYNYSICWERPYTCGNLSNIFYPFSGHHRPQYCGGGDGDAFILNCDDGHKTTTILIASRNFTILDINTTTHSMTMKRTDLALNVCSPQFDETDLSHSMFRYSPDVPNITIFYNCSSEDVPNSICGPQNNALAHVGAVDQVLENFPGRFNRCRRHIQVPAGFLLGQEYYGAFDRDELERGLDEGFEVNYCVKCPGSEGDCWGSDKQSCYYCPDATHCSLPNTADNGAIPALAPGLAHAPAPAPLAHTNTNGSAGAAFVGLFLCITIFCFKYKSSTWKEKFWLATKCNQDIEEFLKNQGAFALRRYKFSDIKKMTDNFKVKLGQGGYGAVYKGKLLTDIPVAVKILNSSKGNGEEFINEVASISRTSHVNVVTLLGFCLEGRKKALIYEFMPNGSLDKFIYNKGPETIASLSWENLFQIAIRIARGLEYLHMGCNTRILHFDIKPHNILLDDNFCPKISDFGLAKLCPKKESMISMSDTRGTRGYIAPELWNKQFGRASHKSDVYSYGMMLLEMVGERENINIKDSQTSEIYFPDWIYKKLELGSDLRSDGVIATEENEIVKKMTIVGLWCIQTFPNDRPTMSRVIDMLEGSINSLEIPPKPVLSSPARSLPESSAT